MNKYLLLLLVLLISIDFSLTISSKKVRSRLFNTEEGVVYTKEGGVRGIVEDEKVVFYGIPFAQPPTGEEGRFANPRPMKPWNSVKDATSQKPMCVQDCNLGDEACSEGYIYSEDCLYLDVFVPRKLQKGSIPVMVFIPGGAFTTGTGSCPLYDATKFANSSIIVVNISYRLGVLGFMGTRLMEGNFGFLDQVRALEWVRDNIEFFGGDKNKVTIYGQSAGSFSVVGHLISPRSEGLFHRAILSSTPFTVGFKTREVAIGFAEKFASYLGCGVEQIDCLHSKSPEEILVAQAKTKLGFGDKPLDAFTIWSPIISEILPGQPLTLIKEGKTHDVPIILGDMQDEATLFVYMMYPKSVDIIKYNVLVDVLFPLTYLRVFAKYPAKLGDNRPQLSKLLNDYLFRCPGRYYVNKIVALHKSPVYHYNYRHISSTGNPFETCDNLACHGSELSYIFGTHKSAFGHNLEAEELQLSIDLNNYWVNFVTNGDPNVGIKTPSMANWESISKTSNHSLVVEETDDDSSETKLLFSKDIISNDAKCDMFDSIGYRGYIKDKALRSY